MCANDAKITADFTDLGWILDTGFSTINKTRRVNQRAKYYDFCIPDTAYCILILGFFPVQFLPGLLDFLSDEANIGKCTR